MRVLEIFASILPYHKFHSHSKHRTPSRSAAPQRLRVMPSSCVCRANIFRAFVRNVTQVHLSSEFVSRAPWQDSRRQFHHRAGTKWPTTSSPLRRQIHTDTDPNTSIREEASTSTMVEANDLSNPPHTLGSETKRRSGLREFPKKSRWRDREPSQVTVTDRSTRFKGRSGLKDIREYSRPRDGRAASGKDDQRPRESAEERRTRGDRIDRTHKLQRGKRLSREEEEERKALKNLDPKERERRRKEKMPMWGLQKEALKEKFPEGWQPRKRLSPDAIAGIKELHKQFPDLYTTAALAQKFEVSPEAIRRILKAKWEPAAEEEEARQARWFRRGEAVWTRWAELGLKPPKKWRDEGITRRPPLTRQQYGPWSQDEKEPWAAEDVDPEKARRLKVQSRIAQNLV